MNVDGEHRTLVFRIPKNIPVYRTFRIEFEPDPAPWAEFEDVRVLCCFRLGMTKYSECEVPF